MLLHRLLSIPALVDQMIIEVTIVLFVLAIALAYALLRLSHKKKGRDPRMEVAKGFRPRIGFTRLDGMMSLSLLLDNESKESVWAEEIEISLSNLIAEEQAAEASCHGIQKIRQTIRSGDMLPISLCEAIYKAAGNPQRRYTCAMSSVLRYRIGEEWFEKNMENYKLRMIGLATSGFRHERKRVSRMPAPEKSLEVRGMAMKSK